MPEKTKILTLCNEGKCCPVVERTENQKIKITFDDDTNTMTIGQFRILLARGAELID